MKFKISHSPEPEVESPMGPEPEVEAPMGELWFEFAAVHSPLSTEPPVSDLDFLSLLTGSSHVFHESESTNFVRKLYASFFRGLQSVFFCYDKQLYWHF